MARRADPSRTAAAHVAGLVSRISAAGFGGYALASAFAATLPYILPLELADAVLAASLASFAVFAGTVIWVFSVRAIWLAWVGVAFPALVLGGIAIMLRNPVT